MFKIFINLLKALFRWISLLVMIPVLAIALLLTPMGLKISFIILSKYVPGELHYQQVTGTLLGPLTIKQLSYRYQDKQFAFDRLYLQWQPSELLAGRISIETLNIDHLNINTPKAPAPTPEFSSTTLKSTLQNIRPQLTALHLPFKWRLYNATIGNLTWQQQPGEPTLQANAVKIHNLEIEPNKLRGTIQGQLLKPYAIQTELFIDGAPQQYHFELKAFNPSTNWLINGKVDPEEVQLDTQKALVFNGELNLHLNWKWQTPMSWQLTLTGQHLDISQFKPDWPHLLDITLNSTGYLGEDAPHFSWNGVLKTAQTEVDVQGKYDQQWDIYWNIKIQQLAELLPFSSGIINSNGELHGSLSNPQTKGHLEASLLRWQDYRADKLNADWDVDISKRRDSFVRINAEQIFTQWAELQKIQLAVKGKLENHQLSLHVHGYNTDLQLNATGGLKADQWQGALQTLTIQAPVAGTWKLSQPAALTLSPKGAEAPALCLQSIYHSQLCLTGKWSGADNAWQASGTGRLNFAEIATLVPDKLKINLPMNLHLNAAGVGKTINQAQLNGSTPEGDISYDGSEPIDLHVKTIQVAAKLDKGNLNLNTHAEFADNDSFSVNLTLPKAPTATLPTKDQAIQGEVSLTLNSLAPLQGLIPETVNPHGKLQAHFTVGGTLSNPLINGEAHIEGGEIKVPGLNIQLNQINLALNAKGSELNYTLTATSANQPLRLTGITHLNEAGFPTELTLTGDTVLLADTPEYTAYVSPKIKITLKDSTINVSGSVDIPKAVLHQLNFQSETSLPEGEVVFVGEHPVATKAPFNFGMQLTINLGKDVKVDAPGLKGDLSGSLNLTSQPGQVMLGSGKIDISNGTYSVYGRQLTITPGSGIIYRNNPLSNPFLSVQAITTILVTDAVSQQQLGTNEITVGMTIGGTVNSPQITLFSSAGNLSQADMLSFLLLGTSSSGISPTNMNLMLQALNTLPLTKKGAGNVEGITNQVKQGLGLSELTVESAPTFGPMGEIIPTSAPTSYFVVGKRITSHIYFRYKYDPFNSVNLFQLNYLFSTNWSLQLETDGSTQSGIDVLYTIQTGTSKSGDKSTAK